MVLGQFAVLFFSFPRSSYGLTFRIYQPVGDLVWLYSYLSKVEIGVAPFLWLFYPGITAALYQ
jgi:hypothetical protein